MKSKSIRSVTERAELMSLVQLSARIGSDPLLTQASSGNASLKVDDRLWIKASGKWMADALSDDIFIPLDLVEVNEYVTKKVDPTTRYPCFHRDRHARGDAASGGSSRALREYDRVGGKARCEA